MSLHVAVAHQATAVLVVAAFVAAAHRLVDVRASVATAIGTDVTEREYRSLIPSEAEGR